MEHWADRIENKLDALLDKVGDLEKESARAYEKHPTREEFEALEKSHAGVSEDVRRAKWIAGLIIGLATLAVSILKDWVSALLKG